MFALLYRGLERSSLWPFARPQGRRSPPTRRLVLETLEDRNLLSPTPSPTMGNPSSSSIPAQAAPPATTSPAATVVSQQQLLLTLTRQQVSPFPVASNTDDVNTCVDQGDCRRTPESTACSGDYGGSGGHCLLQGRVLIGVSEVLIPPTWKTHRRRRHVAMS